MDINFVTEFTLYMEFDWYLIINIEIGNFEKRIKFGIELPISSLSSELLTAKVIEGELQSSKKMSLDLTINMLNQLGDAVKMFEKKEEELSTDKIV